MWGVAAGWHGLYGMRSGRYWRADAGAPAIARAARWPPRQSGQDSGGLLSLFAFALMARMGPRGLAFGSRVVRRMCGRMWLQVLALHGRDLARFGRSTFRPPLRMFGFRFCGCVHWRCWRACGRCRVRPGRDAYRRRIGEMFAYARCAVHGGSVARRVVALAAFLHGHGVLLHLGCRGCGMRLMQRGCLHRVRLRDGAAVAAVVAHAIDRRAAVRDAVVHIHIGDAGVVDVVDGAVVIELVAVPVAANVAAAEVAKAVVDAAVKTYRRSPVTRMPAVDAA